MAPALVLKMMLTVQIFFAARSSCGKYERTETLLKLLQYGCKLNCHYDAAVAAAQMSHGMAWHCIEFAIPGFTVQLDSLQIWSSNSSSFVGCRTVMKLNKSDAWDDTKL